MNWLKAKIIQLRRFVSETLGNLDKKVLSDLAFLLVKDVFFSLKSLEKSGLLVDGGTEAVKHEIRKKQEHGIFGATMLLH